MGKDKIKKIKQLIKENRPSKLKSYVKKHRIDTNDIILNKGRSLLHYCCKYGTGDTFRYLSKTVQSLKAEDRDGNTSLHLALLRANKNLDQASEVYTEIILPQIQLDASLLEMRNQDDISCRNLLDQLVTQRQRMRDDSCQDECRIPAFNYCDEPSWEEKLKEEMQEDEFQSWGRYGLDSEDDKSYGENYEEWTDRIRREYYQKKSEKYKHLYQSSSKSDEKSSKSHKHSPDPDLEKAREYMRQKYEENQKKARENYNIHKKKVYAEKWLKVLNEDSMLAYTDIPWPFKKDLSEMKSFLFCDINVQSDEYRKYLREQQKKWHPDKFVQKLGHRLQPDERDKILDKVKEISQELNKWSESAVE